MIVMGLGQGIIRPARDMMLRSAAPQGSAGKVFDSSRWASRSAARWRRSRSGGSSTPGGQDWVFYLIAIFMAVALVTVIVPKEPSPARPRDAHLKGSRREREREKARELEGHRAGADRPAGSAIRESPPKPWRSSPALDFLFDELGELRRALSDRS